MRIEKLGRNEIGDVWSIDRCELIEAMYSVRDGALVKRSERHDVRGWPPGEPERYGPMLLDCVDHGGTFYGAFEADTLVGGAVLESRFIGRDGDRLQLKFLHVSRSHRATGVGRALFDACAATARALGARWLYVSATPSENTVHFYLSRGCRVATEVDAALFELEPEDVHLELDLLG